jgi:hypothetical protein
MGDEIETEVEQPARLKRTAAQINAERNAERLARINEINDGVDGRRADQLQDVDDEKIVGKFQDGEFDDSPEAVEERAAQEEAEAAQALREQTQRAEDAEREATGEARRLQEEGAEPVKAGEAEPEAEPADEKIINGVRHYLIVVEGQERWLTLKQLREQGSKSAATEESLQRAHDALKQASTVALTPKEEPAEVLSDEDLENIVLSAATGDTEAVKKLVSVIKPKPSGVTPSDVSRLVTERLQTQREIEAGEGLAKDLLSNKSLSPLFKMRFNQYIEAHKNEKILIRDAYSEVAKEMRTEFAPMLKQDQKATPTKAEKKRTIVNPPVAAGRLPPKPDDDQEVPIGTQIDQIAKARGQERAYRQGRR